MLAAASAPAPGSQGAGGMAEWSKAHAWKVCIRQNRIVGSNPTPSASLRRVKRRRATAGKCVCSPPTLFEDDQPGFTSMYDVYLFQSKTSPSKRYVGLTRTLRRRLAAHNDGASVHTARFRLWCLVTYIAFGEYD